MSNLIKGTAWLVVDKDGTELISKVHPVRTDDHWICKEKIFIQQGYVVVVTSIPLPQGSIRNMIGRDLSWDDNPVEI